MAGVLEGIKVIDMGHVLAVPAAAAMFADWGAEVIKVEPVSGELMRAGTIRRVYGVDRYLKFESGEVNWPLELHNRNKKGIAVDLKNEAGREILYKLVAKADIFMSNYELSALDNLKMDYATLSQLNPRLIYAVITGFGSEGPDKEARAFDNAAWARAGMQYLLGAPGTPPPTDRQGMMDRTASISIAAGILGALINRDRTGKGQKLETSLYHAALWILALDIQATLVGLTMPRIDRTRTQNPLWNSYCSKDGRWFQLVMGRNEYWPDFCRAIERPELENDPRFNNLDTREENSEELIRILDEIFASKTMEEWDQRFKENNCIYGHVQSPVEVINDPQALANNFFPDIDHPVAGKFKYVATPVTFQENPASVRTPAPELGQNTDEVLLDLGYSRDDIAKLKDEGVIA